MPDSHGLLHLLSDTGQLHADVDERWRGGISRHDSFLAPDIPKWSEFRLQLHTFTLNGQWFIGGIGGGQAGGRNTKHLQYEGISRLVRLRCPAQHHRELSLRIAVRTKQAVL